jgi:Uma2 family endonuclease
MISTQYEIPQRQLLRHIPWDTYEFLLHELETRHLRITYDQGELEIKTLSHEHEFWSTLLGKFVLVLTLELNIPIHSGGSTTFRRILKKKGLEPDECYWIQNERLMRGKKDFDLESDPPPDLAIEIEVTQSAPNRMRIYAALRVPEVWRFDGESIHIHLLGGTGKYKVSPTSAAFPLVPIREIERFLGASETTDETTLLRSFSAWVREKIVPQLTSGQSKKNGKKSGK